MSKKMSKKMSNAFVVINDKGEFIDRNKPMKPISDHRHVFTQYNCSVCNSRVDIPEVKEVNFCPKCGQRLDWSDEDD